mmetsp:Transcript_16639/g.45737  ORF Transcript_16639/g.45737 Transcript_16639/m.45737 type:complete len:91 (-) Transcript_16639:2186-2458(-)
MPVQKLQSKEQAAQQEEQQHPDVSFFPFSSAHYSLQSISSFGQALDSNSMVSAPTAVSSDIAPAAHAMFGVPACSFSAAGQTGGAQLAGG